MHVAASTLGNYAVPIPLCCAASCCGLATSIALNLLSSVTRRLHKICILEVIPGPVNSQWLLGGCLGEGSLTGPKPCLDSCNDVSRTDAQVQCWVCLLACVRAYMQPVHPHLLRALIISEVYLRRKQELLDRRTESSALPACFSVEKWEHGFCTSVQTHNPNHSMVITLQLFWMKLAGTHQQESFEHRKLSCVAYDILCNVCFSLKLKFFSVWFLHNFLWDTAPQCNIAH